MTLRLYPIKIEAVTEDGSSAFHLDAFDETSSTLVVDMALTNKNIDDFCMAMQKAIAMLELNDPEPLSNIENPNE